MSQIWTKVFGLAVPPDGTTRRQLPHRQVVFSTLNRQQDVAGLPRTLSLYFEKNFQRCFATEQVNETIGEYSPPEMDVVVAPLLDKSVLSIFYLAGKSLSYSASYIKCCCTFVLFT